MGLPEALFGTPFWRGIWAQITLTPVWGSNVTMGFRPILGYPILGVPQIPGVWDMGPYSLGSRVMGYPMYWDPGTWVIPWMHASADVCIHGMTHEQGMEQPMNACMHSWVAPNGIHQQHMHVLMGHPMSRCMIHGIMHRLMRRTNGAVDL